MGRDLSTIGARLREERERLGLNQTDFAGLGEASKHSQIDWENDKSAPNARFLAAIAEAGVDVRYVVTGERGATSAHATGGFVMVPRYDVRASAGHGATVTSEQVVDHLAFREEWVRNALGVAQKDLALITVKGDSMEPTLSNGDLILVDMHTQSIGDNAVYVLRNDGQLLVKRVQRKLDGSIVIKSDNVAYDPETIDARSAGKLKVVGRVVWAGRRM